MAMITVLGSVGIGSAALAVGKPPNGPPGKTGIHSPCPKTGYTSRPCSSK